jgi:ClpP class serine protease
MSDFTPAQWERFQSGIDATYEIFLDRVSTGRKIEKSSLLHIAGGRVFTGNDYLCYVEIIGGRRTSYSSWIN